MAEQRHQAVLAVIADGLSVGQAAEKAGVSRQTLHAWLDRYEAQGLEGLTDRSHRPRWCPHQMSAEVEAVVLELRRVHRYWGPRRIRQELTRRQLVALAWMPSESAIYRCLVRAGLIEPDRRRRRAERFKRWERATAMELWQLDVVGGFLLADGSHAKALTGIDDHSRFCVSARLMSRERTRAVCDGLAAALTAYGCPVQLLTDNGRVFTGKFHHPPVEVLFEEDLPGERHRALVDRASLADHHRQGRKVPPQLAGPSVVIRHCIEATFQRRRYACKIAFGWSLAE